MLIYSPIKPDLLKFALEARRVNNLPHALSILPNAAYTKSVSSVPPHASDEEGKSSGEDSARPIAGPSKRRRSSPSAASTGEHGSASEDDGRPLSGPPSGVPSTTSGDFEDNEELDLEADRVNADLITSAGSDVLDGANDEGSSDEGGTDASK